MAVVPADTKSRRPNAGMTREEWREHKREIGWQTEYDRRRAADSVLPEPPPAPRSHDEIRAEAAQMLAEQWEAQRKRWKF